MSYTPAGALPPARSGATGGTIPVGPDVDLLAAAVAHLRSAGLALTTELIGNDGKLLGTLLPDSGVVDEGELAAALGPYVDTTEQAQAIAAALAALPAPTIAGVAGLQAALDSKVATGSVAVQVFYVEAAGGYRGRNPATGALNVPVPAGAFVHAVGPADKDPFALHAVDQNSLWDVTA